MNKRKSWLPRKLLSIKTWVTFWAIGLITYIVIANRIDFMHLAELLSAIPFAYIPLNVLQKKIFKGEENNTSDYK